MNKFSLSIISACIALVFLACNSKKSQQPEDSSANATTAAVYDSTKVHIDIAMIDSVKVIFTENEQTKVIDKADWTEIADNMLPAQYDTIWNRGDIMIKMVAPDYTMIISYKNTDMDKNDWLMIWKTDGRTKFKNKWYMLPQENMDAISELLEKYKSSEK